MISDVEISRAPRWLVLAYTIVGVIVTQRPVVMAAHERDELVAAREVLDRVCRESARSRVLVDRPATVQGYRDLLHRVELPDRGTRAIVLE